MFRRTLWRAILIKDLISKTPHALPELSQVIVTALGPERIELELTLCLDGQTGGTEERSIVNRLMLDILRFGARLGTKFGGLYEQQLHMPEAKPAAATSSGKMILR
jgi:hypothetical protein